MTAVTSRFLFVTTDYLRKLIIEFELVLVVAVDQVSEVGRGYLFQMI